MPLLTIAEFKKIVGTQLGGALIAQADYDAAELAASDVVAQITGIEIPEDAGTAPDWCKEPCAHIMLNGMIGLVSRQPEQIQWAAGLYSKAIENLNRHKLSTPAGRPKPERGTFEGGASW